MISRLEVLQYESSASAWWMSFVGNKALQSLCAKYLAWKVNTKYQRYLNWQKRGEELKNYLKQP